MLKKSCQIILICNFFNKLDFLKIKIYNIDAKKNNGENFYYLGDVEKVLSAKEIKDSQGKSMVKYIFKLKKDVKKELLDYFNM